MNENVAVAPGMQQVVIYADWRRIDKRRLVVSDKNDGTEHKPKCEKVDSRKDGITERKANHWL